MLNSKESCPKKILSKVSSVFYIKAYRISSIKVTIKKAINCGIEFRNSILILFRQHTLVLPFIDYVSKHIIIYAFKMFRTCLFNILMYK